MVFVLSTLLRLKMSGQSSAKFPRGLSPNPSPSPSFHCVGSVLNASEPLSVGCPIRSGVGVFHPRRYRGSPLRSMVELPLQDEIRQQRTVIWAVIINLARNTTAIAVGPTEWVALERSSAPSVAVQIGPLYAITGPGRNIRIAVRIGTSVSVTR